MTNNTNLDLVIVLEADRYAAAEHGRVEQKRKYADLPYIVHPRQVAGYVRTSIHNDAVTIATALLHDVLEDTRKEGETVAQAAARMRAHFCRVLATEAGPEASAWASRIVEGVLEVTDVSKPEDGNRKTRKALDRDHAGRATAARKTVKLADIKSNMPSIVKHDPGFARKWVREKADVYPLLEGGDPDLFKEVGEMIAAYRTGSFNPEAYKIV